jgi:hypothetical protein
MSYATVAAASAPQLAYLRSPGHWSKLYLAAFNPSVIYTARLNGVPGSKDRVVQVNFTSGSGNLADIIPGMTMYVGTVAGSYNLGMVRIRKAPIAGTFYIGEESEIDWQASCYLTVVNDFDIWARHINTVSDTVFYMDQDITYTDQNSVFNPIPIMGGHRAVRKTGSYVDTIWNWSNSYVIDSSISGYSVAAPTAQSITNGTTSTPTIRFNTMGWHAVYLTVTAANGKTSLGVRYVYVYGTGAMPAAVFQLGECSEDYDAGGWSAEVTAYAGVSLSSVPDRALCILFAEDYYGGAQVSVGQLAGCENVLMTGRIAEESYSINPELTEATFRIQDLHYWMQKVNAFPVGAVLTTATPTNWAEMQSPTVQKVGFMLVYWASTISTIADVYLPTDSRIAKRLSSPAANLWAQLQEIAFATIQARPGVDRFGRLFVEIEPQLVPEASRTWPSVMTITNQDWAGTINLTRVVVSPLGAVQTSGVVIDSTGSGGALFGLSPGHVFKRFGGVEVVDRLLLSTQLLTNQLASLYLSWKNTPYSAEMTLAGNYRMMDCFPRQAVTWTIPSAATPRGFSITSDFVIRRVALTWDSDSGLLETHISIEMESTEQLYTDGDIPGAQGDLADPPPVPAFPKLPAFPIILPTDIEPVGAHSVLLCENNIGLVYTEDFDSASPTWETINVGISMGVAQWADFVGVCPNGAIYVADITGGWPDPGELWRAPYAGGTFVKFSDYANSLTAVAINKTVGEQVGFTTNQHHGGAALFYIGAGSSFSSAAPGILQYGVSGSRLSYGFGKWLYNDYGGFWQINAGGTSASFKGDPGGQQYHVRAGTSGFCYCVREGGGVLRIEDNGNNIVLASNQDITFVGSNPVAFAAAASPDGSHLMARGLDSGSRSRSSDFGGTWTGIPNLPLANWTFENCGDNDRWIAGAGGVQYTENFGTTWANKTGNLATLTPYPAIRWVRWIG